MSLVDFHHTMEQIRLFADREIGRFALDADMEPSHALVKTIWRRSESLGIPALPLPEVLGGRGYPDFCLALILDVMASACPGVASVYAHHYAACLSLLHGEKEHPECLMNGAERGGTPICALLLPQNAPERKLSLKSRNGKLFLQGVSALTGNIHLADKFCVFAKDGDLETGITCMVIDAGREGLSVPVTKRFSGLKLNPMAEVLCEETPVSEKEIVGGRGRGHKVLETTRILFHNFLSAMIMGAVRNALKKAFDYAEDRYQFGAQIIHNQEIQKRLRRMMEKVNEGTSAYIRMFEEKAEAGAMGLEATRSMRTLCKSCACEIIMDALRIENDRVHASQYGLDKIIRDVTTMAILDKVTPPHSLERLKQKAG